MTAPATTRDRARRGFTTGVVLAALVGGVAIVRLDDGPPTDEQIASAQLADSFLPHLGTGYVAGTGDLRDLVRPADEVRTAFESSRAVYRVVTAEADRATLVVWQRTEIGLRLWERTRSATGHGCVTLTREAGGVRTEVVDCPEPVGPMPPSDPTSWRLP